MPTIDEIRAQFPALEGGFAYLENAGGSQLPAVVADRMRDYMLSSYVQIGAGYPASERTMEIVQRAHRFANQMVNGEGIGQVALGPSSSQLFKMLADGLSHQIRPGDEIIVSEAGHESNIGPWMRLEERGAVIKTWKVDPQTGASDITDLEALISPSTKIVACVHVSNLLGEIMDLQKITSVAHRAGAKVVVDGVAYAPHHAVDAATCGVDFYGFSTYKTYGPHMAVLFGRNETWEEVRPPNHFFIDYTPSKFELGGVNYEGCAGLLGLEEYFAFLAPAPEGRERVEEAYQVMAECEDPLVRRLLDYLSDHPKVRLIGPSTAGRHRVGTVSFLHAEKTPGEIVASVHRLPIGIRHGSMYAWRLCQALGIDPVEGVVRVSTVHYNNIEEIERLIHALDQAL